MLVHCLYSGPQHGWRRSFAYRGRSWCGRRPGKARNSHFPFCTPSYSLVWIWKASHLQRKPGSFSLHGCPASLVIYPRRKYAQSTRLTVPSFGHNHWLFAVTVNIDNTDGYGSCCTRIPSIWFNIVVSQIGATWGNLTFETTLYHWWYTCSSMRDQAHGQAHLIETSQYDNTHDKSQPSPRRSHHCLSLESNCTRLAQQRRWYWELARSSLAVDRQTGSSYWLRYSSPSKNIDYSIYV